MLRDGVGLRHPALALEASEATRRASSSALAGVCMRPSGVRSFPRGAWLWHSPVLPAYTRRVTDRERLFDAWAPTYDDDVAEGEGFPFEGYERTLAEVVRVVRDAGGGRVLELGVGTGRLTERLVAAGCEVWGIDLSGAMLERARARVPAARLHRADLFGVWPDELAGLEFDAIVSSYVFHEFLDTVKVDVLRGLAGRRLARNGVMVIADLVFPSREERERQHAMWREAWDDGESYWVAEEIVLKLRDVGLDADVARTSFCAGVVSVRSSADHP
jgi:putative AdoMet-dependent methyltransferase